MSAWLAFQAVVLGIVEGLTEFLPVSSTGHLIIASDLLDFGGARAIAFNIIIQTGAMAAVVWEYRRKIFGSIVALPHDPLARRFALNVIVAFVPAAALGVLLSDLLDRYLFNPVTVAVALVAGGVIILWAERREHRIEADDVDAMTWKHALKIGLAQCLALIPGTSRSGATIIGGLLFGLSRRAAAEFSFFLAIPTLFGAALYSGWKARETIHAGDLGLFAIGTLTAFVFAMIAVRGLLRFIGSHGFGAFAWYRIGFGLLILATWLTGSVDWSSAAA